MKVALSFILFRRMVFTFCSGRPRANDTNLAHFIGNGAVNPVLRKASDARQAGLSMQTGLHPYIPPCGFKFEASSL